MEINLKGLLKQDFTPKKDTARVKEAVAKKEQAKYEPTLEEQWERIAGLKLSDSDKVKIKEVKEAIESGELGVGVTSMKKFTKAHVIRLYQQLKEMRKELWIKEMIEHKPDNYFLIQHEMAYYEMLRVLSKEKYIGLDTETTGLEHTDHIVGISFSAPEADKHYYVPFGHTTGELQLDRKFVLDTVKHVIEDRTIGKVLHNAKFDSHMFWKEGIDLKDSIICDTQTAFHILNENEDRYALKILATKYGKYFGFEVESHTYEELFGKCGFEGTPLDIGHIYACKDTHLVVEFYKWIMSFFNKQVSLKSAHATEVALLHVIIDMEREGIKIDLEYAKDYSKMLTQEIEDIYSQIKGYLGDINIGSSQQLKQALVKLGVISEKAKSVDKEALKAVRHKHEVVELILKVRKLTKLSTTYIEPIPKLVRKGDRLHGQFNQHKTVTTRLSSDNPNLQNFSEKARGMMIPREGYMLVEMDFSQIEPRYMAHISGDVDFRHPYKVGIDLYSSLASKTFKVPLEECGDGSKYRKMMKVGLLACMYGISDFQLGQSLGITTEEATEFMADFMSHYPITDAWMKEVCEFAFENEYVNILGGYKRRFPNAKKIKERYVTAVVNMTKKLGYEPKNIWEEKKLKYDEKRKYWDVCNAYFRICRQAVNAVVQGSSAFIMKMALLNVSRNLKDNEYLISTVHDSLLLEVPISISRERLEELGRCMTSVAELEVPIKCDIEVSTVRWNEKQKLDEFYGKVA